MIDSGVSRSSPIIIRFIRRWIGAAFAILLAAPLSAVTLTILHTSDLHGHVDPQDELADRDFGEGLARVAAAARAVRLEGQPVLLLDSGDTIQGTPAQALVAAGTVGDGSDPIVRAMNLAAYDAMAVGNHEFDFGLERLHRSRLQARFPWLSANIVDERGRPAFAPYLVRSVAGVRVGILGLTTPNVPSWEPPDHVAGLRFLDTVEEARRYVPLLRGKERCDLVIVLAHQGFERDPATGQDRGTAEENQAYAIATQVTGIDLLLTGHTHVVIEPRKLAGAWISQPGRFGNVVTRFEVTLSKRQGRWQVDGISGKNLPMKEVSPDPRITAAVEPEHTSAMRALAETVATLPAPVDGAQARVADTGLLDWLHAVQRREGKADLSFASLLPGGLSWSAGALTVREVWSFYPYENALITVRATGRQVRQALEDAARCVSGVTQQDGIPVWARSPEIWGYNCDTAEGIEYAIDPTQPEGHRVLFLRREGRPVADDATFTVAINSYRASGGGGYAVWRNCPRVATAGKPLRDLLLEDARSRKTLKLEPDFNWFLAPTLPEAKFTPN